MKTVDLDTLLAQFREEHKPSTVTEDFCVRQMAHACWKLQIFDAHELRLLSAGLDLEDKDLKTITRFANGARRLYHQFAQELRRLRAERQIEIERQQPAPMPKKKIDETKPILANSMPNQRLRLVDPLPPAPPLPAAALQTAETGGRL